MGGQNLRKNHPSVLLTHPWPDLSYRMAHGKPDRHALSGSCADCNLSPGAGKGWKQKDLEFKVGISYMASSGPVQSRKASMSISMEDGRNIEDPAARLQVLLENAQNESFEE